MGGTKPGLTMPDNPVSGTFYGESAWPTDPDEAWFEDPDAYLERVGHEWPGEPDEAWVSDPDAYLEEVVGYMNTLQVRGDYASALGAAGRHDEAIALLEQVIIDSVRVMGPDHPKTL